MRRETRKGDTQNNKNLFYIGGSILGIGILAFTITFVLYGNKMNEEQSRLDTGKIAQLVQNTTNTTTNTQAASTQMGKSVEESKNQVKENTITNTTKENTNTSKKTDNKTPEPSKTETKEPEKKEISFVKPVEGDICKDYAKENLVYSETLQEWTTHLGIDIKAEKTTIVKAAADGKVKSIKNDPRYGLSIIIEHQEGIETLYANLLTSEFVQVGEEVKQGQSIGTVGNTATFEIADQTHLHFEISKNGENLDPNQYLK